MAVNIGGEIKVRRFAKEFLGRKVKLPWEEPLVFSFNGTKVYLWAFGSFVVINAKEEVIGDLVSTLRKYTLRRGEIFTEKYRVIFTEKLDNVKTILGEEPLIYGEANGIIVAEEACIVSNNDINPESILRVVSYILAQSVSLERIESISDRIVERAMELLDLFGKVLFIRLRPAVRELVSVMRTRLELLSDIMVLRKPEITWEFPELDKLYELLRDLYEIPDRFEAIDRELSNVQELSSAMADIILAYRESVLEVLIIALIILEIVLSLLFLR